MAAKARRRVVTGINERGQSCVIIDGAVPATSPASGLVWRTEEVPADNSGIDDIDVPQFSIDHMHDGSTNFLLVEYPPGTVIDQHATDTIDYLIVLEGEILLTLEAGEARLKAGDFLVDRGVVHGWHNDSDDKVVMAIITVPALPVGQGRTF